MKKIVLIASALILVLAVTACGSRNNKASNAYSEAPAASTEAPAQVKKIIVGTGNQFPKVAFVDDSGKLTGFDVELVREIDKRLPEYEFELQVLDFTNILLSLETK